MEKIEPETKSNKKSIIYTVILTLLLGGSSPWWWDKIFSKSSTQVKETAKNTLPIADPGQDETITLPANSVILNGSNSYDKEGEIASFLWQKQSGPNTYQLIDEDKKIGKATNLVAGEYEFRLTVQDKDGEKDIKSKKIIVKTSGTDPEILPTRSEEPKERQLEEFGTWGNSSVGDNEMDTDNGDVIPVKCTTEIVPTDFRIMLKISFYIREDGGDHTTFNNTIEREVSKAPAGKKIIDVKVKGGAYLVGFEQESRGQNHGPTLFRNTSESYWKNLRFVVDGPGSDDNTRIGVAGRMEFTVVMENL